MSTENSSDAKMPDIGGEIFAQPNDADAKFPDTSAGDGSASLNDADAKLPDVFADNHDPFAPLQDADTEWHDASAGDGSAPLNDADAELPEVVPDNHDPFAPSAELHDDSAADPRSNDSSEDKHDNLVPLDTTPKDWYGYKVSVRFVLNDNVLLPTRYDEDHFLYVRVEKCPVDPRLQIFVEGAMFPLMMEFRAQNVRKLSLRVDDSGEIKVINLEFLSTGCITVGVSNTDEDEVHEQIRRHMLNLRAPGSVVKLQVYMEQSEDHEALVGQVQSLSTFKNIPWYPYLGKLSGKPVTQYGQLLARATVQQAYGCPMTKMPPSNHFYDIREAAIKFVYGVYLEHHVSLIHLNRVGRAIHKITVFEVPNSNVLLGAVEFGKLEETFTPADRVGTAAIIPDGTTCQVTFQTPVTKTMFKFHATTVPNVVNMPVSCDLVLLLLPSAKPHSSVVNQFFSRKDPEKTFDCRLTFHVHTNCVKAQVNAVNQFCFLGSSRWHAVVLNQEYMEQGKVDVFKGQPEEVIQLAYERIYADWQLNPAQKSVFELLRNIPENGWAFIEGIFGCGKTLVQALLAKLLTELGFHVLIVAPTNAAVQAISKTIFEKMPTLNAVRVVFAGAEIASKFSEDTEQATKENVEHSMFRLLQSMASLRGARYNVIPAHDLHKHVEDLATAMKNRGEKLLFRYQPESTDNDVFLHLDESDDEVNPENDTRSEYDAIDFFTRFQSFDFSSKPKFESPEQRQEWELQKSVFQKSTEVLQAKVISTTKLLLCTRQLAMSSLIQKNFATEECHGIVVIGDEDGQSLEPVQLIPLTLLREAKKIKANLRFGDIYQLPPPPSESARSNYSEFGSQLQRSLFERALRYHPAAATLNIQYRMHPKLSKFPSKFTYKSRLLNGAGCENIVADPVFSQRLAKWAKPYLPLNYVPDEDFSRLLGINVANADIDTNNVTSSRSNPRAAKIVSELLQMVFTEPPYPTSTITIVTPYNAQRALYLTVLRDLRMYC